MIRLATYFSIAFLFAGIASGEDKIEISFTSDSTVSLEANGVPPLSLRNTDGSPATASLNGTESSECRPYGRASSATGTASVAVSAQTERSATLEIFSSADARGGHYRTCPGGCILGNCVGNHGNDTRAFSNATAVGKFVVNIASNDAHFEYILRIGTQATGGEIISSVTDHTGKVQVALDGDAGAFLLSEKTSRVIVTVTAAANAQNEGGCCSDEKTVRGTFSLAVAPAPILFSAFEARLDQPFINKGKPTEAGSYKNVAVILLDGQVHCTGTLISAHTVITAAHCIANYNKEISDRKFSVAFGQAYNDVEFTTPVVGADYPNDPASGYAFNGKTYEDDIGLLYLQDAPPYSIAALHHGDPSWNKIIPDKKDIMIVGFGYNVLDGEMKGLGRKREGLIKADAAANRSFKFVISPANTCRGDSGGPSFIEGDDQKTLLLGVTSYGNKNCTEGTNTRVDAFAAWIEPRLQ